tara:strand:- start:4492 stop:4953 length:462 start_codon:yes stop_codon:yes gene_type:complete
MVVTEAMLVSMEELQRHAGDMENHVKTMMEDEGRRHGMELDRRRNARELWNELNKHMANCEGHEPEHTHADGTTHAHEGGDMPHEHGEGGAILMNASGEDDMGIDEAAAMPDDGVMEGSQGSGEYLPDPAAQAAGMAPPIEVDEDDTDSNAKS